MQTHNKVTQNAGEPMFDQYQIFNKTYKQEQILKFPKIPVLVDKPKYLCKLPSYITEDENAEKNISRIKITINSNSASIIIGNGKRHYAEVRQKNIRQHL